MLVVMNSSLDVRRTRAERRAARGRTQHLVTADEHSLVELETFLTTLPLCASGRVFIEVKRAAEIRVIDAPDRMTVTWLVRDERSGTQGSGRACAPGQALTRASCAWADEMLCDVEADARVTLLGGYLGTADIVEHLIDVTRLSPERIYAPERFGLIPVVR